MPTCECARAPREQSGEPGRDEGELDADRDREHQAAECGRDQRLGPAFEQPARPVEEQEGDEQRRQRQQQRSRDADDRKGGDGGNEEDDAREAEREAVEAEEGRRRESSEERDAGKEGVRECRSRWTASHEKKNKEKERRG